MTLQDILGRDGGQGMVGRLFNQWEEMHCLPHIDKVPKFPSKPSGIYEPGECCNLHWCVCKDRSRSSDAHCFFENLIKLMKPFVAAIRQPRDKENRDSKKKKTPQYPPQRKLLEQGLLVLKLAPRDNLCGFDTNKLSSWARASNDDSTASIAYHSKPLWIHFSFVNFQTYESAVVRLLEVDSNHRVHRGENRLVVTLKVPDILEVATLREFFFKLDLDIGWIGTWFQILADSKRVGIPDLRADTLHLIEMLEPKIPTATIWKGSAEESLMRQRRPNPAPKRGQGPRPRTGHQKPALQDVAANILQQPLQDDAPSESLDLDYLFDPNPSDVSETEDPLEDLCDLAEAVSGDLEWPQDPPQPGAKSESKGHKAKPEQSEALPSSSSSSKPLVEPAIPVADPNETIPAPSHATDEGPARVPAASRKKEVSEQVLLVPPYGDIRFNPKTKVLTAHCWCENHGVHVCRKQRTTQAPKRITVRTFGQGRPLGFLGAWLFSQDSYENQASHVGALSASFSLKERVAARKKLKEIGGSDIFFGFERPKDQDEQSEPDTLS